MPGVLYIVATPIGNLDDISVRAVKILGRVAVVACEDTRQTHKLLEANGLTTPLLSLHEHNEEARAQELIARMRNGDDIALVSDAGTPLISDPGYRLVREAVDAQITVVPIPGASAIMTALSASGLATDAFAFIGFLPHKSHARQELLARWKDASATLVFFESPHRITQTLAEIAQNYPARRLAIGRELTKMHEEFLRGTAAEVLASLEARPSIKGEFTVVMERGGEAEQEALPATPEALGQAVAALEKEGLSRMEAIKTAAKRAGLNKREAYDLLQQAKG